MGDFDYALILRIRGAHTYEQAENIAKETTERIQNSRIMLDPDDAIVFVNRYTTNRFGERELVLHDKEEDVSSYATGMDPIENELEWAAMDAAEQEELERAENEHNEDVFCYQCHEPLGDDDTWCDHCQSEQPDEQHQQLELQTFSERRRQREQELTETFSGSMYCDTCKMTISGATSPVCPSCLSPLVPEVTDKRETAVDSFMRESSNWKPCKFCSDGWVAAWGVNANFCMYCMRPQGEDRELYVADSAEEEAWLRFMNGGKPIEPESTSALEDEDPDMIDGIRKDAFSLENA